MKRIYDQILFSHFKNYRQMAFLSGPRQIGKTTTAQNLDPGKYLNWDINEHRQIILNKIDEIIPGNELDKILPKNSLIVFDEIHKFVKWKNFLKGFFDKWETHYQILVTGSARLNIYKRGSDSLMGRYFLYRMHPFTVAELLQKRKTTDPVILNPARLQQDAFEGLVQMGGFPEPLLQNEKRFKNRWQKLRHEQLFREDLRDLANIHEIARLEILAQFIENQTGQLINYSNLSRDIQVSVNTIKSWISILEQFFYCFRIKPWFKNVPKTLLKQPKIYLWDWSNIKDSGARLENLAASHLLKAVHFYSDAGLGNYDLYFLRDKMKREIDFLVTQNNKPWILVEVKSSHKRPLSPSLEYYAKLLNVKHAFQLDFDSDFIEKNPFKIKTPVKVPASTFLSQLV